jgi:hypothetical protein
LGLALQAKSQASRLPRPARAVGSSAASTIGPLIPMAATRACRQVRHGCRHSRDSGGSCRSGTSARWLVHATAAHRTRARCRGGRRRRTSHGGCGCNYRAGARRPADRAAQGQGLALQAQAWVIRPQEEV